MSDTAVEIDRWATRGSRLRGLLREQGLAGLLAKVKDVGVSGVVRQIRYSLCIHFTRRWDAAHGVDTGGQIDAKDLDVVGPNGAKAAAAVSTSPATLTFLSQYFPKDRSDYTFIDIGAGKGRALLMASEMGFRRATGVEFSLFLCATARANIETFKGHKAAEFSVVHADAFEYRLPPDKAVLYFCNPFALELWPKMVGNIVASLKENPRPMRIIIAGSEPETVAGAGALIAALPEFRRVAHGKAPFYLDTYKRYHFESFVTQSK